MKKTFLILSTLLLLIGCETDNPELDLSMHEGESISIAPGNISLNFTEASLSSGS